MKLQQLVLDFGGYLFFCQQHLYSYRSEIDIENLFELLLKRIEYGIWPLSNPFLDVADRESQDETATYSTSPARHITSARNASTLRHDQSRHHLLALVISFRV
jgi:hypothetical protein